MPVGNVIDNVFGAGQLTAHHPLYAMAMLGLVPASVLSYTEFANTTHTFRFLKEKFGLFNGAMYCEDSYKALAAQSFYLLIPISKSENDRCKYVQGESSSRWLQTIQCKQRALYCYDFHKRCVMEVQRGKQNTKWRVPSFLWKLDSDASALKVWRIKTKEHTLVKKKTWLGKSKKRKRSDNPLRLVR
jgi:hypothetical protein